MIRVVIADDQPVIRTGFSVIAESAGDIEVVGQAGSGPEAVELVRTLAPDVVLMDVRMPDGDGLTATAQLQDTDTAVVIVTTLRSGRLRLRSPRRRCGRLPAQERRRR